MSRRHHGGRPHRSNGHPRPAEPFRAPEPFRPADALGGSGEQGSASATGDVGPQPRVTTQPPPAAVRTPEPPNADPDAGRPETWAERAPRSPDAPPVLHDDHGPTATLPVAAGRVDVREPAGAGSGLLPAAPATGGVGDARPFPGNGAAAGPTCTAPQLRRFIKSRPYVPMHELRRRFGINGGDDDVTAIDLPPGRIFVGLPAREGTLLGDLLRGGEIGYELSLDPRSPIVIGLYPMRPVARS